MVEQEPLAVALDDRVVVGPAARGVLLHEHAPVRERPERVVPGGVGQRLRFVDDVGEREVVDAAALEHERPLLEALRERPVEQHGLGSELEHVVREAGASEAAARPVQVGLPVAVDEHVRVDPRDARDGRGLRRERTVRGVGDGDPDPPPADALHRVGGGGEVEKEAAVLLDGVRRPHRVRGHVDPRHVVLAQNHAVVGPVDEVGGRECVVVFHAEPVRPAVDVVRGVHVDPPVEGAGRGVGRELVGDERILGRRAAGGQREGGQNGERTHGRSGLGDGATARPRTVPREGPRHS